MSSNKISLKILFVKCIYFHKNIFYRNTNAANIITHIPWLWIWRVRFRITVKFWWHGLVTIPNCFHNTVMQFARDKKWRRQILWLCCENGEWKSKACRSSVFIMGPLIYHLWRLNILFILFISSIPDIFHISYDIYYNYQPYFRIICPCVTD